MGNFPVIWDDLIRSKKDRIDHILVCGSKSNQGFDKFEPQDMISINSDDTSIPVSKLPNPPVAAQRNVNDRQINQIDHLIDRSDH